MLNEPIVIALRNRRVARELTQGQLASMAGMSEKTLQRIESGSSDLKISQYRALVSALSITDLDVSLDMLAVDTTTPWDVAAAARVLLPQTRHHLVASIMAEWQRTDRQLDATLKVNPNNDN